MYQGFKIYYMQWLMIRLSEPVCLADRRGESASRSQIIILLRTRWQKVTEFMVPLPINVSEKFLT